MAAVITDDRHYKDIADVIRDKGPYPEGTFKPEQMAQNIQYALNYQYSKGADTGMAYGKQAEYDRFWDTYQQNGNRRDYGYAFYGASWRNFKPKYSVTIGANVECGQGVFGRFDYDNTDTSTWIDLDDFAEVDFSQSPNVSSAFASSYFNTVRVDFGNAVQASSCFNYSHIKNLYIRLSEKCTTAYMMFSNMRDTENIIFTEDSVLNYNFDFKQSTKLTHESLMSIINALKDCSETGTTNTCSLGSTNLAKLTDAEKAIATQKGWTLV